MLKNLLFTIKDHRRKQGRRYQLGHILLFAIFAILSNATSYRKIQVYIEENYSALNETFELNWKRMPAYTTIRATIQGTSADELEACFRQHSVALDSSAPGERFMAFDGKVLRGSFDHFRDQKAVQVLSAFLTDSRMILAHEEIAEKTNEIPTAQELMTKLGLSGCTCTFDAIHCQEKTLQVGKETNNDVIVQVKENQKTLFNDCQTTAETIVATDCHQEPTTKTRNRIESRQASVFTTMAISDRDKWHLVKAIVKVERKRRVFDTKARCWKQSDETSFYIATTVLSAQTFCRAIRNHWGIENSNHYVRDVTMSEDKSRIRTNPHLFAKLRSFALNILRANCVENVSIELFKNCVKSDNVLNYVGIK